MDHHGQATEAYPFNPNGSPNGLTSVTNKDGRFTVMMPHPERVFVPRFILHGTEVLGRRFAMDAHVPQRARLGGLMQSNIIERG